MVIDFIVDKVFYIPFKPSLRNILNFKHKFLRINSI